MNQDLDPSPPQWVTLSELAERWKVCKRTITRIPNEDLPCYTLPNQRRYRLQDVVRFESMALITQHIIRANEKGD